MGLTKNLGWLSKYITADSSGNLGVGVASPLSGGGSAKWLTVDGSTYGGGFISSVNGVSKGTLYYDQASLTFSMYAPTGVGATIHTNGSERMRITSGGNVGIGTATPGVSLEVNGLIRSIPVYNNTTATAANLVVSADGTFERSTSSLKYKKEVRDYDKGLETLLKIRPVYYKGKSESDGDKQFAGLIAEEIHDLGLTEFVQYADDGTPDALAYTHMIALLVKSIQELTERIKTLENK